MFVARVHAPAKEKMATVELPGTVNPKRDQDIPLPEQKVMDRSPMSDLPPSQLTKRLPMVQKPQLRHEVHNFEQRKEAPTQR